MFLFALALVVVILGLVAVVVGVVSRTTGAYAGGAVAVVLGIVLVIASSLTTVGTKDVGVVTAFGKPTGGDLSNGIHWKAPWENVTEMDGAIQPDTFSGSSAIAVRIGDSTTATVNATIRWRIVPDQASVLYQDYRSNDVNESIRDSLVKTQFNAALNDVLGQYNPLAAVAVASAKSSPAAKTSTAPNLDAFSAQVKSSMETHLQAASQGTQSGGKAQVEVVSVTLQYINLAQATQDKINDFQKEVGATRVAQQAEQTAIAQAKANRNLSKSVSHAPNVLVAECFNSVADAIKARYPLPAGFSCWSGSSAVVVPSK